MADDKMMRLLQVAKRLNVGISTIADYLNSKGFKVDNNPNSKINTEQFNMLVKEFESSMATKKEASNLTIGKTHNENIIIKSEKPGDKKKPQEEEEIFIKNHPAENQQKDVSQNHKKNQHPAKEPTPQKEQEVIKAKLPGLKVVDKIDLDSLKKAKTPVEEPVAKVTPPVEEVKPVAEQKPIAEVKPTIENPPVINKGADSVKPPVEQPPVIEQKPVAEAKSTPAVSEEKPSRQEVTPVQPSSDQPVVSKEPEIVNLNTTSTQNTLVDTSEDAYEQRRMVKVADVIKADALKKDKDKDKDQKSPAQENPTNADNDMVIEAKAEKLQGLTVLGKIELPVGKSGKKKVKPVASSDDSAANKEKNKRKRKRIRNGPGGGTANPTANPNTNANPNVNVGANKDQGGTNKPKDNRPNQRPDNNNRDNNRDTRPPVNRDRPNPHPQGGNRTNNPNQNRNNSPNSNPAHRNNPQHQQQHTKGKPQGQPTAEVTDKQIQDQIKNTLARLSSGKNAKTALRRQNKKDKRMAFAKKQEQMLQEQEENNKTLKVTEFISANDLSTLIGVSVNEIISKCLSFGMFVSINQRLDAEAITIIADEFGYDVEFTSAEQEIAVELASDDTDEDLEPRAPIVTIMGHVDHGKTSLLDYIRRTKVVEGEAGGITQHIGAYDVKTNSGKRITFLDTPGHEAFTAMRARGAKVTDVVIIVIAADDNVMPQTKEAINHAQVAGVPIVIAINKVDKPNANPQKIREELAKLNLLVESWGGKYQEQEISAKTGIGVEELLEKVLLEAEILDLKANPAKNAVGTVIESSLDKGRGYVTTLLVQAGSLHVGDIILAGAHFGRVKAMTDHLGKRLTKVGPSTPVQILGISGAPQAGDKFNVLDSEREAREIATRREQILREQSLRTTKRITLSDLGRRIFLGNFKQLNIIVKGDVDGSIEALSDSLLKLSTEEIEVNIIHKAVGQISESDVLLATASDAIIVGFQVRPSASARKVAEKEQIEIRLYSIIYDAINEVRDAMEGMLAPSIEEVIIGNAQVRDVFKITKVGTVAGCYVLDGVLKRNAKVRVVRDGIVVFGGGDHGGEISALKRFKDDVNEVKFGYECGLSIKNFNDIRMDDTIECYEEREVKRKLV